MKKAKRLLALALALGLSVSLAACGPKEQGGQQSNPPSPPPPALSQKPVDSQGTCRLTGSDVAKEITLWTYPIGNWARRGEVKALTDAFKADTGITVSKVALRRRRQGQLRHQAAKTPDLVMEGGASGRQLGRQPAWWTSPICCPPRT